MKSAPAIAFDYRPSRRVAAAIVGIVLLGFVAIGASGIDGSTGLALAIAAGAYAGIALRRFLASSVRRVAWHEAGHWRILGADGQEHVAEMRRAVVRGAWIALTLRRSDGTRVALVLAPDNCTADVRRRLRVRLARLREVAPVRI